VSKLEDTPHVGGSTSPPAYAVTRRFERVRVKLHIRVHRVVNGASGVSDGQAQDVSEAGIGAYIPDDFHVNETVKVEVVLPFGTRPIVFDAVVRDVKGFRFGFEFLNVKEADRETLRSSLAAFAVTH
jgi:hypothetical protein